MTKFRKEFLAFVVGMLVLMAGVLVTIPEPASAAPRFSSISSCAAWADSGDEDQGEYSCSANDFKPWYGDVGAASASTTTTENPGLIRGVSLYVDADSCGGSGLGYDASAVAIVGSNHYAAVLIRYYEYHLAWAEVTVNMSGAITQADYGVNQDLAEVLDCPDSIDINIDDLDD